MVRRRRDQTPPGYWTAVACRAAEILGPDPTKKTKAEANAAYARARNEIDFEQPQLRLAEGPSMPPLELTP